MKPKGGGGVLFFFNLFSSPFFSNSRNFFRHKWLRETWEEFLHHLLIYFFLLFLTGCSETRSLNRDIKTGISTFRLHNCEKKNRSIFLGASTTAPRGWKIAKAFRYTNQVRVQQKGRRYLPAGSTRAKSYKLFFFLPAVSNDNTTSVYPPPIFPSPFPHPEKSSKNL